MSTTVKKMAMVKMPDEMTKMQNRCVSLVIEASVK